MQHLTIKQILKQAPVGDTLTVHGWVRTFRNEQFIALTDGSTRTHLQVVVDREATPPETLRLIHPGAAITATGKLVESLGRGQDVEIQADTITILGPSDPETYPIQPKRHTLEFLRKNGHLRFRTQTFGAVFRIRHHLALAIHRFFDERGFFYLHTPIITASDAEGAGEMFTVTALDLNQLPKDEQGRVNFKEDFFGKHTHLTVSGQLEAELGALALSKVYTFGPTFRAENSNTTRHLAEFWMIEPEMAFADLNDDMNLAEDMLKYLIRYVKDKAADDLEFLAQRQANEEKNLPQNERSIPLLEKLDNTLTEPFARITYTEAFDLLRNSKPNKKGRFKFPVSEWGIDLQSEHERYLVEKKFKKPVIVTDYPKDIKAFYMRLNDDGKTVAAMDILVPGVGELVGGSQREERYDLLVRRMEEMHIPVEEMQWYLDTRRFGTCPHAGFGLGFERLVQFVTGMANIRDVIPFPRFPGNAAF